MVLLRIARFLEKVIMDVRDRHSSTLSGPPPRLSTFPSSLIPLFILQ